jgi:hypothetical protein
MIDSISILFAKPMGDYPDPRILETFPPESESE